MPLILGLPFLTANKIVCNYAERTCTATAVLPPYDLLKARPKRTTTRTTKRQRATDILAAIRDRIHTLTKDEELASRESELGSRFAQVFEPPPHVNDLPTKPLARITLKDANKMIKT